MRSALSALLAAGLLAAGPLAAGLLTACTSGPADDDPTDPGPAGGGGGPAGSSPDGGPAAEGDGGDCSIAGGPAEEAIFTAGGAEPDLAIEDRLVAFLQAAVPGSRVRAAFAYLDQPRLAEALIDADRRGVDVRLVLDERNQELAAGAWQWNTAVAALMDALGPDRLVVCGGADSPPDGGGCVARDKQHNAFLLLSETCDGSTSIVLQTSAYPTKGQLFDRDNLVVVRRDDALFAAYDQYWRDLAHQRADDTYYRIADGERGTRLFLYPRGPSGERERDPSTDTVWVLLHDNVDCAGGTRLRLAMSYWSAGRDYLVTELARLAAAGCDVRVVANPDTTDPAVLAALRDAFDADHLALLPGVHHKYLLLDGRYAGEPAQLVWTGTQDFTLSALRANDEVILRLSGAAWHDRFLADWTAMVTAAAP